MTTVTVRRKHAFRAIQNNVINALAKAVKNRVEANWREQGAPAGNTLLEYACELGNIPLATWLVDYGADINAYCVRVTTNIRVIDQDVFGEGVSYLGPLTTAVYTKIGHKRL